MGYYRVLSDRISFVDEWGQRRKAVKNSIIYMELLSEVKRMKNSGDIEQVDDYKVRTDKNLNLIETDGSDIEDDHESSKIEESEAAEKGNIVQAEIDGKKLIGEILFVYADGDLKIAFEEDSEQSRRMKESDVEVLG